MLNLDSCTESVTQNATFYNTRSRCQVGAGLHYPALPRQARLGVQLAGTNLTVQWEVQAGPSLQLVLGLAGAAAGLALILILLR